MPNHFVLLDCDGTLIDTFALYSEGIPPIVLRFLGRVVSVDDILAMWGTTTREILASFARRFGRADTEVVDAMYADFERYYVAHHATVARLFPHVEASLPALRALSRVMGVVTTRPRPRAELIRQLPWSSLLDFLICGDDVERRKPAPDGLNLAIERHARPGDRFYYIGDAAGDIEAARASRNHVVAVAALWGPDSRSKLLEAGPGQAFERLDEFVRWLEGQR